MLCCTTISALPRQFFLLLFDSLIKSVDPCFKWANTLKQPRGGSICQMNYALAV